MQLEKLLKEFLNLNTRVDFREWNKGNKISLDLNKECDKAYVRCEFKRWLTKQNIEGLRLVNNYYENLSIDFKYTYVEPLNFDKLNHRNKVIATIENWITDLSLENRVPLRIEVIK